MLIFLQRYRSCFSKGDALKSLELRRRLGMNGFTLTELMVVVAIMTILTGAFLFQQRQFDSTTLLRSLAYSVALSVREAQTYGTSVRAFGSTFPAYGIYFNITTPKEYILFADVNGDGEYSTDSTEFVDSYKFQGNYNITAICASRVSENDECADSGLPWMTINFKRPNPDACIATYLRNDICDATPDPQYYEGYIQITGPGNTTRSVRVTPSGQISVGAVGD